MQLVIFLVWYSWWCSAIIGTKADKNALNAGPASWPWERRQGLLLSLGMLFHIARGASILLCSEDGNTQVGGSKYTHTERQGTHALLFALKPRHRSMNRSQARQKGRKESI